MSGPGFFSLSNEARARLSLGGSSEVIYARAAQLIRQLGPVPLLVDVGCGAGALSRHLQGCAGSYIGCDLVRYEGFPAGAGLEFREADLNQGPFPVASGSADVVVGIEIIEHLENPRHFIRELVRIARPGGHLLITTPNQLSLLSKATLVLRNEFNAFQGSAGLYPAHITALLEQDLVHIAEEVGLTSVQVSYTDSGRIPGMGLHWPARLGLKGRAFSDNVLLFARKP